jgi:hypothetical protein
MDTLQQIGTNNTQAFKIVEVSFKGRPVNEICKLEWKSQTYFQWPSNQENNLHSRLQLI